MFPSKSAQSPLKPGTSPISINRGVLIGGVHSRFGWCPSVWLLARLGAPISVPRPCEIGPRKLRALLGGQRPKAHARRAPSWWDLQTLGMRRLCPTRPFSTCAEMGASSPPSGSRQKGLGTMIVGKRAMKRLSSSAERLFGAPHYWEGSGLRRRRVSLEKCR